MADKEHTNPERMEKIVSLCKRRGFIFQSAELYGGLNGCWDYGPLGAELKKNLKAYWWQKNVQERDDIVGLDGSVLTHQAVLTASGHVGGFSDPTRSFKPILLKLKKTGQARLGHLHQDFRHDPSPF